jgi:NAD(P)-dependent dehydrogenase (short-subunit alcohol dehydrogenase family)
MHNEGYNVYGTTSKETKVNDKIIHVAYDNINNLNIITEKISSVVWAMGDNCNDNISTFDESRYTEIMTANVGFILKTMHYLVENDKLANGAKMVIVSSIWEEFTRENKLSYTISKAALSGLVKNTAYDLSKKNILINNVLPGVIDNDMSRKTLSSSQFEYIQNYTGFNRLIDLNDVYSIIKYLINENTGITGQSIKVDLGFTNLRKYN